MSFFRAFFRTLLSPFRFLISLLPFPSNNTIPRLPPPSPTRSAQQQQQQQQQQKQQSPNTGPTLLINHSTSTLLVHAHTSKHTLATLAPNTTHLLRLPPDTRLHFSPKHPDTVLSFQPYDTVANATHEHPVTHHIHPVRQPVSTLPPHFHPVPACDACLRGYHILDIDPFIIESEEGARQYVYEPLAQDGCDYQLYDGNYYCKRGWLMHRQDVAWGNLQTSLHDSQDSFLNGLTSSIHDSRDNAATRSPSVLYFLDAAPPAEALFTRSSELAINYTLTVDPATAQFHPDFIAAIRALPATTATVDAASTYDSLDDALKQQLTALIAEYGTHVPEKTTFGGYYALVTAVNEHDLKTALQRGVNLWAGATVPVDGVAVHGSPPADAELLGNPQLTFHASAFKYVYRGGSGGKGKWGGKKSMGGSVPVGVELVRLSEVIQRGRFPMEGMEKEELAVKQRAVEMAIDKEIGKPIKLNEKRVSVPTFRIRALRMELHEASRHRKSLCGPLYMEPSETLRKFNVDAAAPARYVLFDRPELKPYDWRNGDEYRFREHDAVHAASFRVPLDWFGREEMYVKVYGELMESDKGLSGMDEYRLKPLTIWLGEMDKEEWWVDERFRKVQHVTTGKNVNKADGKVFVYVETDWVLDE